MAIEGAECIFASLLFEKFSEKYLEQIRKNWEKISRHSSRGS